MRQNTDWGPEALPDKLMRQARWTTRGVPVLGVAGPSGSGKTTLLEGLIPRLSGCGLRVGVLKHAGHELRLDEPGTDTSRVYSAGAAVIVAQDPGQLVVRRALSHANDWHTALESVPPDLDLLLVEGYREAPIARITVGSEPYAAGVLAHVGSDVDHAQSVVCDWLAAVWSLRPWGVARLDDSHVMAEGGSDMAWELTPVPGVPWPLSLLLAAMRWRPDSAWIITPTAVEDSVVRPLLDKRAPGKWLIEQGALFLVEPQLGRRMELLACRGQPVIADAVDLVEALRGEHAGRES